MIDSKYYLVYCYLGDSSDCHSQYYFENVNDARTFINSHKTYNSIIIRYVLVEVVSTVLEVFRNE